MMPTKLYVGNIPSSVSSRELTELFEKYGKVIECDIIKDYAFVVRRGEFHCSAANEPFL